MRTSYSRLFRPVYLIPVLAVFVSALPAQGSAETKKATITVMKPGDLWLDDVQYTKVARGQRDGTWGYDVTYVLPGIGEKVLFWPRSKIDLDSSAPNKYRIQFMPRGKGRLLLPDRITTKSLPEVYHAILLLEGSYTKEARGNMVVAEAFATVTGLAAGMPARTAAGVASRPAASSAATRAPVRPTAAKPTSAKPTSAKPHASRAGAKPLTQGAYRAKDFAKGQLDKHFAKHAAEWGSGNITKTGYLKRAQDLLGRNVGGDILGAMRKNGDISRYNTRTNEFAVGAADGTIRSLFRPKAGLDYWKSVTSGL